MSGTRGFRLVALASILVLTGIAAGAVASSDKILCITLPLVVSTGGILHFLITKKKTVLVLFIAFAIGFSAAATDFQAFDRTYYNGNTTVTGRVCGKENNGFVIEDVTLGGEKVGGKALVRSDYDYDVGTTVSFEGEVKTYDVDVRDTFSARNFNRRTYYRVKVKSGIKAEVGNKFLSEKAKSRIETAINRYLNSQNAGVMKSLLFGDKTDLTEQDDEVIKVAGVSHVFAVSGLHIGFLAGLIMFVLRKLRVNSVATLFVVIGWLLFYGAMTGFPSGVKRATIMLGLMQTSKIFARKNDSITTLGLSAAIITLTNPRELFDVGFLMSFAAVLGIVCFYQPFFNAFCKITKNKFFVHVFKLLATTLSANLFVLPITINVFKSVSVYAPLANLVILPVVSVVFPFATATAILSLVFEKLGVLFYVTGYAVDVIRIMAQRIYALPSASAEITSLGDATWFYILFLVIFSRFIHIEKKYKFVLGGACGTAIILVALL